MNRNPLDFQNLTHFSPSITELKVTGLLSDIIQPRYWEVEPFYLFVSGGVGHIHSAMFKMCFMVAATSHIFFKERTSTVPCLSCCTGSGYPDSLCLHQDKSHTQREVLRLDPSFKTE